jgi:hypothetical protein
MSETSSTPREAPAARHSPPHTGWRARVAALAGALVLCAPALRAEEPPPPPEEFMDFLEYLGSWDGKEADWTQFMSEAEVPQPQGEESIEDHVVEDHGSEGMSAGIP